MKNPILKIDNLESYYGPIMAIRGVSLVVNEGQIVTVLGANGAGKTTLLKTISGIMDPEKGTISLMGENIQGIEPDKIVKKGITHVPEGREVFPILTVEENLKMGAFSKLSNMPLCKPAITCLVFPLVTILMHHMHTFRAASFIIFLYKKTWKSEFSLNTYYT